MTTPETVEQPPAQETAAAGTTAPPARRRRGLGRLLLWLCLLGLVGGLLWAGIYVSSRGFGRRWRAALQAELRRHGLDITVGHVTLDPFEGLVAENVRLHRLNDRRTRLLTIGRAALDIDLKRLIQRRANFLRSVDLRGTRLDLPVDPSDPESPLLRVRGLRAKVYFLRDRVQLAQAEGICSGIRVSAAGEILHAELYENFVQAAGAASAGTPALTPEERVRRRERARQGLFTLRRLHFPGEPPRVALHFNADFARPPSEVRASAELRTGPVRLQPGGYEFQSLRGRVDYGDGALRLREGELTDARGRLGVQGEFRLATGEARVELDGACDLLGLWRQYRPGGGEDPLAGMVLREPPRLRVNGRFRLPAANAPPDFQLTGHFGLGRAEFRGLSVERFDTDFSWHGSQWFLRDAKLASAPAAPGGPPQTLTADVLCADGQFRAKLSGALGPAALSPVLPARLNKALDEWDFHDLPRGELQAVAPLFKTGEIDWTRLRADGKITLGRTHFRRVPFRKLTSDFSAASGALTCRSLRVERDEGTASVDVFIYDFTRHESRLEGLRSTLFPAEVAAWIDPDLVKQLRPYRFPKPPLVTGGGVVQFDGGMASRLTLDFSAPAGMGYTFVRRELNFSNVSGHVVFTDPKLFLENMRGEIFGGAMRGGMELNLLKSAPPDYRANLELENIEFVRLTKLYFNYDESQGRLTGTLRWTGRGEDPGTMRGAGAVRVERGNVFGIPIFGPLSPVLDEVLPGVGKNVAHQATADFLITGGKIYNGNLAVKGGGFSMLGSGWLGFVDDSMNFRLRINAQGLIGTVLYPVSKLFEYSSAGPLHKPVWRPGVLAAAGPNAVPPPAARAKSVKPPTPPVPAPKPR